MKIISVANNTLLKILEKHKRSGENYRRMHFCVETKIDDGVLLYNLLTKEMVLLNDDEYSNLLENDYLKDQWFVVPENTKEKEYADMIRWIMSTRKKESKGITNYTIFTTTDCNARCFYCFELGRSRIPMSNETAQNVVAYIKKHCENKKVNISWFGGEPLYNYEVIDTICDGLQKAKVEYTSNMVSNGYLFDDAMITKAVEKWNLKWVQVTLDGTENVYNKIKAYIYEDGSAYQRVIANVAKLLSASIEVQIRLNMDMYNAEDLLALVEEIGHQFKGREGLRVYAHHLFDGNRPLAERHTTEEWKKREEAMRCLEEKIVQHRLGSKKGINKQINLNHCMADSGTAVTILPDGSIGLCEHYSETELIGHVEKDEIDQGIVNSWKETAPRIPECDDCFYYPDCIKLKKCANDNVCFYQDRTIKMRKTQRAMQNEYNKWKLQESIDTIKE